MGLVRYPWPLVLAAKIGAIQRRLREFWQRWMGPTFYPSFIFYGPDGTCVLYWDRNRHWRAEYAGRSRDYVHPHAWQNGDPFNIPPEFFRMQDAAQNMAWGLVYEVPA